LTILHICICLQMSMRWRWILEGFDLYRRRAELIAALANPHRLLMVEMLSGGELCVCEFNNRLDIDYSTISRHLAVLRKAGIAGYRRSGKRVFYSLRVPCVLSFLSCFDEVLRKNAERDALCLTPLEENDEH